MIIDALRDKYSLSQLIEKLRKEFCLSELLAFYDVPKSSYLNWAKRAADDPDAGLRERIKEIFADTGSIYGFRRIGLALRDEGLTVPALFIRELSEGKRDCTKHVQKGQLHRQQQNGDILWTHEKRNVLWKEIRYKEGTV